MPECLISGDLRNSFFKVVRSSSESRLYLSWNALQNISVNCCTLSPGDCIAFWTSRLLCGRAASYGSFIILSKGMIFSFQGTLYSSGLLPVWGVALAVTIVYLKTEVLVRNQ